MTLAVGGTLNPNQPTNQPTARLSNHTITTSMMNFFITTDPSSSSQPEVESISAKDLLKQHQNAMKQRLEESKKLAATPTLGKGFSVGQDISLDVPVKKTVSKSAALAKVRLFM